MNTERIPPDPTADLEAELQAARPIVDAARLYCFRLDATAETAPLLREAQRSKIGQRSSWREHQTLVEHANRAALVALQQAVAENPPAPRQPLLSHRMEADRVVLTWETDSGQHLPGSVRADLVMRIAAAIVNPLVPPAVVDALAALDAIEAAPVVETLPDYQAVPTAKLWRLLEQGDTAATPGAAQAMRDELQRRHPNGFAWETQEG